MAYVDIGLENGLCAALIYCCGQEEVRPSFGGVSSHEQSDLGRVTKPVNHRARRAQIHSESGDRLVSMEPLIAAVAMGQTGGWGAGTRLLIPDGLMPTPVASDLTRRDPAHGH